MLKSRIEAKDPERSELDAAMAEFLSNGGEIDVIDRPVSVKSTQKDVNYAAEIEAYKNKKADLMQLMKIRNRVYALRGCSLSDKEICARLEITNRQLKRILG